MNPKYQPFFDANATPGSDDPYVAMGYKSPTNAQLRYNSLFEALKKFDLSGKVVADAGAGTGTMWTHYVDTRLDELKALNLGEVVLVDSCQETMDHLYASCKKLNDAGVKCSVLEADFTTGLPKVDVVTSVGALNYYNFSEFFQNLDEFDAKSSIGFIFESNIQSPHTSTDVGTWNPSIDMIYQYLYTKFLSNGKSRINLEILKKWTSVWSIHK